MSQKSLDEDMTSWWAAKGKTNEWIMVDLQKKCTINAIQVNYAEHDVLNAGNELTNFHRYLVECSKDKKNWEILIDKRMQNVIHHMIIQNCQRQEMRDIFD